MDIADGSVIDLRSRRFTDLHVEPVLSKLTGGTGRRQEPCDRATISVSFAVAGLDVSYHGLGFGAISIA